MKENNPLYQAFIDKNYAEIEKLLYSDNAKELIDVKFENEASILHIAAARGYDKIIPRIINLGVKVDIEDNNNQTPLHYGAGKDGNIDVINMLIQYDANIEVQDCLGNTPLLFAAEELHINVIERLIECGADVRAQNDQFNTPLHLAAKHGDINVIKLLIQHNANVNPHNINLDTPLSLAIQECNLQAMIILLNNNDYVYNNLLDSDATAKVASDQVGHQEAIPILEARIIIYELYKGKIDSEKNYENKYIVELLPILEFLLKKQGLSNFLLESSNIPAPIRQEITKFMGKFKNINQIPEEIEVHVAVILNKLYPEDFPSVFPYSQVLKYQDSNIDMEMCNLLLKSYEQKPECKPINFFNWTIDPNNRKMVLSKFIECYKEAGYLINAIDKNFILPRAQCVNFRKFKQEFNSLKMKEKVMNYLDDMLINAAHIIKEKDNAIERLENEVENLKSAHENNSSDTSEKVTSTGKKRILENQNNNEKLSFSAKIEAESKMPKTSHERG